MAAEAFLGICERGDLQGFRGIVKRVNVDGKNENGYSGLALAVRNGHSEIAYELIREDADVNSVNEAGQSVLFLASWHNREDCVKMLLASGALINLPDNRGWTPLIIAVYHNYSNIVQVLLENGADVSHKDCFGKKAAERAKTQEIVNLLQRFEVQEKKATPLGKIMNSSISSIQSDNKPPKRPVQEGKKNSKLQEEIENHVKSQTKMVEKELAGEWNEILEQCLNEEISQAEEILTEEIEAFVLKTIAENFSKLKETSLSEVDENYRAKGFKIVPTQVRTGFSPMFSLNRQGRTKKTIEKVRIESDDVAFDSTLTDTNDLRLEVVKFIERSIENLADKFERLSQNVIANEINQRIQRMKGMICGEVQEFIAETVHAVRFELEQCVQERIKEIVGANQDRHEAPYREQFAKRYSPAEQNYKPKYEENYEFIENLANNYSGMKSNAETQNMAGNYTQEHKTFKKVAKKAEKPSIPRTDVSSVLQQFLKK